MNRIPEENDDQFSRFRSRQENGGTNTDPRRLLTLEDALEVLGGHRLEIVFALAAHESLPVGNLAQSLVLRPSAVSKAMERLMEFGLVRWSRVGTSHLYRLTERVRSARHQGMVQVAIVTESCDWVWLHRDYGGDGQRVVMPPSGFFDGAIGLSEPSSVGRDTELPHITRQVPDPDPKLRHGRDLQPRQES